jgi:hypothetical protein
VTAPQPRRRRTLTMYGRPSDLPGLEWDEVERALSDAGTYWVVPAAAGQPHPRPVWGVWQDDALHLSIGSPVVARQIAADARVTVHLDSGVEVVIVEGTAVLPVSSSAAALERYRAKYDRSYEVAEFGHLTRVVPATVIAWEAAGWAGREGFRRGCSWQWG